MAVDPFPSEAAALDFITNDAALTAGMAGLADLPDFMVLCAGLVDLTGDPDQPPYAGLADTEMLYAGSLLKICAMVAAFELRSRVRQHVAEAIDAGTTTAKPGWEKPVFAALLKDVAAGAGGGAAEAAGHAAEPRADIRRHRRWRRRFRRRHAGAERCRHRQGRRVRRAARRLPRLAAEHAALVEQHRRQPLHPGAGLSLHRRHAARRRLRRCRPGQRALAVRRLHGA